MNAFLPLFAQAQVSGSAADKAANILAAARAMVPHLNRSRALDRKLVAGVMTMSFGGSDADGAWCWRDAYDAMEAAVVLQLRRLAPQISRLEDAPAEIVALLASVTELMALPLSRDDVALDRARLTSPELVLAALSAAIEALHNEGRAPTEDPAFALLVRHLSEQIVGNPTEALEQACQLRLRERRNEPLILALLADPVGHDAPRKQVFKVECLRLLKLIAGGLGLEKADYDLRWNPGGPAVSGDACLHSDRIFVNLSQGGGPGPVMFRGVTGRKDYAGGMNHWAGADELADPLRLADRIGRELGLPSPPSDRLF